MHDETSVIAYHIMSCMTSLCLSQVSTSALLFTANNLCFADYINHCLLFIASYHNSLSSVPSSVPTSVPTSVPSSVPTSVPSSVPSSIPSSVPSPLFPLLFPLVIPYYAFFNIPSPLFPLLHPQGGPIRVVCYRSSCIQCSYRVLRSVFRSP